MSSGLYPEYGPGSSDKATTDSSGAFALDLLETWYRFFIQPPRRSGYDSQVISAVRIAEPNARFDYRFTGVRLSGRLLDPNGVPLENGSVEAYSDQSASEFFVESRTHEGTFSMLIPEGARYRIAAFPPPGGSGLPAKIIRGLLASSDTTMDITLTGEVVTGVVRGPGGLPLGSAEVGAESPVQFDRAYTTTGSDGAYRMYLPVGSYRFTIVPGPDDRYIYPISSTLTTISGPTTVDFDLDGTHWSGIVRDGLTGNPVEGARVKAMAIQDATYFGASFLTGTDGGFRLVVPRGDEYSIQVLYPEEYSLRAYLPGITAGTDSTFDITLDPLPTP